MIAPSDIVARARHWARRGADGRPVVPWHHQGRVEAGIDCAGLILVVGWELGALPRSINPGHYGRHPTGELDALLEQHLVRLNAPGPGCVVAIRWLQAAHHLAIYTGETLIHCHWSHRGVAEHGCTARWRERIVSSYGYPGVWYEGLAHV